MKQSRHSHAPFSTIPHRNTQNFSATKTSRRNAGNTNALMHVHVSYLGVEHLAHPHDVRVVELPQHRNLRVQLGHLPRLHTGDVNHLARKLAAGSSMRCLNDPPVRSPPELLVLFRSVGRWDRGENKKRSLHNQACVLLEWQTQERVPSCLQASALSLHASPCDEAAACVVVCSGRLHQPRTLYDLVRLDEVAIIVLVYTFAGCGDAKVL